VRGAWAQLGLGLAAALALTGCGTDDGGGSGGGSPPSTDLQVTVWPAGRAAGRSETRHVVCPGSRASCRAVAGLDAADLAPTPPRTACAAVVGGPAQAHLEGRLNGRRVSASFDRRDSCALDRWMRLRRLLGPSHP
jgi:hypothetical protein